MLAPTKTDLPSINLIVTSDQGRHSARPNNNPADFEIIIPNTPSITRVMKILPVHIDVPRRFYTTVRDGLEFGKYVTAPSPGGTIATITIKPGNYTSIDRILNQINVLFTNQGDLIELVVDDDGIVRLNDLSPPGSPQGGWENYGLSTNSRFGLRLLGISPENVFTNAAEDEFNVLIDSLQYENAFTTPATTGPSTVLLALDGAAGGNLVNGYDGNVHEVVCPISLNETRIGSVKTFTSSDVFVHDVDYSSPRDFSRFRIRLLDCNLAQLYLPSDAIVTCIFKLFHVDSVRR